MLSKADAGHSPKWTYKRQNQVKIVKPTGDRPQVRHITHNWKDLQNNWDALLALLPQ